VVRLWLSARVLLRAQQLAPESTEASTDAALYHGELPLDIDPNYATAMAIAEFPLTANGTNR
jgi:hypothetical protein